MLGMWDASRERLVQPQPPSLALCPRARLSPSRQLRSRYAWALVAGAIACSLWRATGGVPRSGLAPRPASLLFVYATRDYKESLCRASYPLGLADNDRPSRRLTLREPDPPVPGRGCPSRDGPSRDGVVVSKRVSFETRPGPSQDGRRLKMGPRPSRDRAVSRRPRLEMGGSSQDGRVLRWDRGRLETTGPS